MRGILADTRPLRIPDFRRLFIAHGITVIGAQVTVVVVPAQLYDMTGSSAYVGLAGLFGLVPLIIFGLYGGVLADHFDRRTMLLFGTWGLVATSLLLAAQAAVQLHNPWVLLWIYAAQQSFFAIAQPARTALLPRIVPAELLPAANALGMTAFTVGAIAGPMLGGVLIPVTGFAWLYVLETLTLFSTLWAATLLPRSPRNVSASNTPGLRAVLSGFAYLRQHPILLSSFVVDLIAMVFGFPRIVFPEVAHVTFGGPTEGGLALALLMVGLPVGAALGGVFSGWVSQVTRHGRAVIIAILFWGLGVTLCGAAIALAPPGIGPWLWIAVAGMTIGGAADMASAAFRTTILLESATDEMRGRLQGVFMVVVISGPRVADLWHGAAATVVSPATTIIAGGVLTIVLTACAAAALPQFWRYEAPSRGSAKS